MIILKEKKRIAEGFDVAVQQLTSLFKHYRSNGNYFYYIYFLSIGGGNLFQDKFVISDIGSTGFKLKGSGKTYLEFSWAGIKSVTVTNPYGKTWELNLKLNTNVILILTFRDGFDPTGFLTS